MSYLDDVTGVLKPQFEALLPDKDSSVVFAMAENIAQAIAELDRWVKVEDGLPSEGEFAAINGDSVWIRIEYKDGNKSVWYERGWYNHRAKIWQSRHSIDGLPVTHWADITPPGRG